MSGAAQAQKPHDPRVSGLLLQHMQAMKAGNFSSAFDALRQIVELERRTEDRFPRLDPSAIFAPLGPIDYVIRAIDLCPGAPALWAGYGYSGKTAAAQSAALSIAAGLPDAKVWGCFGAKQGRVLHVDYEQGSRLTRERYQRLAVPMMIGPSDLGDRLTLVTMPPTYLDDMTAESEVERLVSGYQLVIIDSLRAAAPTLDENDSGARRVLDMLSRVSERTGAAFVVIHHARKPNATQMGGAKMAIRGSGALFDGAGSVLVFEGEKGQPTRVSHEKARTSGILSDDFELVIEDVEIDGDPRAGLMVSGSAALSREEKADEAARAKRIARNEKLVQELRSLFIAEPEQGSANAIIMRLGRKAPDVRAALQVLIDSGDVKPSGETSDKRHSWLGRK